MARADPAKKSSRFSRPDDLRAESSRFEGGPPWTMVHGWVSNLLSAYAIFDLDLRRRKLSRLVELASPSL